jgi:streptomycin 6-kinase
VLRLTDGDGCVRLLRYDAARGALLLERLGRSLVQLGPTT